MTTPTALDLRDVAEADVYLDDDMRESVTDRCRSRCCARSTTQVVTIGGAVPAFFAGLLPEGVRLGVVISSTKTSADDHLTLLLAIGADTVGNVGVVPSGANRVRRCRCST